MSVWPGIRDPVRIETWPSGFTDRIIRRDFFVDSTGGVRLGRATSHWAMIDLGRRRPVRMPESVRAVRITARDGETLDVAWGPDPEASPGLQVFRHRIASGSRELALARSAFRANSA